MYSEIYEPVSGYNRGIGFERKMSSSEFEISSQLVINVNHISDINRLFLVSIYKYYHNEYTTMLINTIDYISCKMSE